MIYYSVFNGKVSVSVSYSYQLTPAVVKGNVCILTLKAHFDQSDCLLSLKGRHHSVLFLLLLLSWRASQATAYMGRQKCPEEMRNSTRLWIRRDPSLPRDRWQPFIDWGTTQGRLSLPTADVSSTIVKRSMLADVDKLSSCSRFSDSVVGFTGQKTQPTASKYWRSTKPNQRTWLIILALGRGNNIVAPETTTRNHQNRVMWQLACKMHQTVYKLSTEKVMYSSLFVCMWTGLLRKLWRNFREIFGGEA